MNRTILFASALTALLLWPMAACKQDSKDYQAKSQNPEFLHAGVRRLTDIIRNDIFAPPISSRIYAYSSVAAYEALVPGNAQYQSLAGQLNGLQPGPKPEAGKEYCFPLASANALSEPDPAKITWTFLPDGDTGIACPPPSDPK